MALKLKNIKQVRICKVDRTNTTAKAVMTLPADAQIVGINVYGTVVSNALTTATVKLQSRIADGSAAAVDLTAALDVKTANGLQVLTGATNLAIANPLFFLGVSKPQHLLVTYAETGTASTLGGPWYFAVEYL